MRPVTPDMRERHAGGARLARLMLSIIVNAVRTACTESP